MLFDPATVEVVRDLAPPWLVVALAVLSFLGSSYYQVPMLVAIYLATARDRVATWLAIVAGSYSFRSLLKSLNGIDRPPVDSPLDPAVFPTIVRPVYEHPAEISTTSFPSGHVIAATVLWGLLVVDTDIATRRMRLIGSITVVTVVASSRVVLAAHYIEDVVAGVLFGCLFLGAALALREWSGDPVAATFTLAALVSGSVVSFTTSTTASVVLGVSIGALAVGYAPGLRLSARSLGQASVIGVASVGALSVSQATLSLTATGIVAGAIGYWAPRQPIVRSLVSASKRRIGIAVPTAD